MTAVPTTRVWVTGEVVTAAEMNNNISAVLNWLLAPAILRVRPTANQSISASTYTSILFDTEDADTDGMHSTVTNTSRATAVHPGWYWVGGAVAWVNGTVTTRRGLRLAVNGTLTVASGSMQPAIASTMDVPAGGDFVFLNVGDYVELQGFQDTAGSLNAIGSGASQDSCRMCLFWESN